MKKLWFFFVNALNLEDVSIKNASFNEGFSVIEGKAGDIEIYLSFKRAKKNNEN